MSNAPQHADTPPGQGDVNAITSPAEATGAGVSKPRPLPEQTIARLSLYRRILSQLVNQGETHIRSHDLARFAQAGASQVRRDMMTLGFPGSRTHGYSASALKDAIGDFLYGPGYQRIALAGAGNLGQALISYFTGRWRRLSIRAAFDTDPRKTGRLYGGIRCHALDALPDVVHEEGITLGIVAVPAAAAQDVAVRFAAAGIRGVVNYAPVRLVLPESVAVENVDMTSALEKVAFYARVGCEAGAGMAAR